MSIPFWRPYYTGKEKEYLMQALEERHLIGDGPMTKRVHNWFTNSLSVAGAFFTPSGTASLEMCAILANIQPGDEVIMPSYTFVSTANAVVLRGGVPVFVDIRGDTQNIDETLIEAAITNKTKAICVVHYAGVACEMEEILAIAKKYNLYVIEDAAQGISATYKEKPLGCIGHFGVFSFHGTKNITCGEGGLTLVRDSKHVERAEICREKGTNRSQFFRGEVDKYTWIDLGSSYLNNEIAAAFLLAQLEAVDQITSERIKIWESYHKNLHFLELREVLKRPHIPTGCKHNGHIYYVKLRNDHARASFTKFMKEKKIAALSHFVPLHSSPAGQEYGRSSVELKNTQNTHETLVRLPIWNGIETVQNQVIEAIHDWAKEQ